MGGRVVTRRNPPEGGVLGNHWGDPLFYSMGAKRRWSPASHFSKYSP